MLPHSSANKKLNQSIMTRLPLEVTSHHLSEPGAIFSWPGVHVCPECGEWRCQYPGPVQGRWFTTNLVDSGTLTLASRARDPDQSPASVVRRRQGTQAWSPCHQPHTCHVSRENSLCILLLLVIALSPLFPVIRVSMACPKLFPSGLWLALKVCREGESVLWASQ